MASLRQMLSEGMSLHAGGASSVEVGQGVETVKASADGSFHIKQKVIIRQRTGVGGPSTYQVRVGEIVAMGKDGGTAKVSLPKPGGKTLVEVSVSDLSPVTEGFRRSSVQFHPAFGRGYRGGV